MSAKVKPKKEKSKISKLIELSDSENDENDRELSFYIDDRVKLMKEVLKIIKPKKIKSMAPDCIKDLDIEEINSMLLEELLGISNKRLKYIFNGQNLDEDTSSTDPEEEKQPIDIISLDDVSDDDFVVEVGSDDSEKKKHTKTKNVLKRKRVKKEKQDKKCNKQKDGHLEEENLMSVLELLELQARARAIRSQLILEASKKNSQQTDAEIQESNKDDDDDDVIIETPKNEEIVITSSDSEVERKNEDGVDGEKVDISENETQRKKITLIRNRVEKQTIPAVKDTRFEKKTENEMNEDSKTSVKEPGTSHKNEHPKSDIQEQDEDEIILIVDQEEMDGLIGN